VRDCRRPCPCSSAPASCSAVTGGTFAGAGTRRARGARSRMTAPARDTRRPCIEPTDGGEAAIVRRGGRPNGPASPCCRPIGGQRRQRPGQPGPEIHVTSETTWGECGSTWLAEPCVRGLGPEPDMADPASVGEGWRGQGGQPSPRPSRAGPGGASSARSLAGRANPRTIAAPGARCRGFPRKPAHAYGLPPRRAGVGGGVAMVGCRAGRGLAAGWRWLAVGPGGVAAARRSPCRGTRLGRRRRDSILGDWRR
jgi:hypothetical protein